jgi:diguanylate cyclase (GGDEF)-like protein/PAS domain S-box-containing protein
VVNQNGEIVLLNMQAEKQFGYHRDELLGQQVKNIIPQGFAERLLADGLRPAADALTQQIGTGIELTGRRKNGREFPIEIMLSPLESSEGILVTAAIRDISVRKEAEDRIVHLNRVYAMLSGINTLLVRVRDRDELFRAACRLAVEGGGFRMSLIGIVDKSSMKVIPVASAGKGEDLMTAIIDILSSSEGAPSTMIARAIRERKAVVSNDSLNDPKILFGKKYAESGVRSLAVLPLIVADEAVGVLALYAGESEFFHEEEMKLLTDLTGNIAFAIDHIEKGEKLNYLAYYDVLTGLANRNLFLERVAQYMRSAVIGGHKLALYLIDLERFKNINDSLGQPAGDALLKQVAEWLTSNAGDVNLLARVGADHFAAVLPEVKQEADVARLLEKTVAAFLDHPFHLNDSIFRVAAKFGVALFPDDGADADTLFKNAEAALKKAKASGDRCLFYTQKMTATVGVKLALENQLRQALDKEEFVLHYQPKVNLVSGKPTGAEALIRWNDPRTGLVPPGRFIPILEETGLIYEVGRWALRKAIEEYLRWCGAGLAAVRIAVNVSPLQLRNRGFVAEIKQAIGIDARAAAGLELEITESVIMEDVKHSIATLQAIRAMGVRIAIDDFGTGFSSLSSLAKLPVDTLKIDRSFVIDMTAGPQGLALVSTIITLAHSLKLKVVAEGVETEEQSRLLLLLNCDEMQGFLFSKPVASGIFETRFLAPSPAG